MAGTGKALTQPKNSAQFGGQHAVVIGSSMAGLLAARVLSDHFAHVTIVERDGLTENADPRKGVPQARHAHGLLARGQGIIEDLFPGLFAELVADGALRVDMGRDLRWYQFGTWKTRCTSNVIGYIQSRPLLEWKIRARVAAIDNIHFLPECDVIGLQANAAGTGIVGVQVKRHPSSTPAATLPAELVIDASGRGSRTPAWLAGLGYGPVAESEVTMHVGYASRIYRRPAHFQADWQVLMVYPKPPGETRLGIIMPMEGDRWMVTLSGWHHDYPPTDEAGFLEYARSLPVPDLYETIKDLEPLTPIVSHKTPSNLRREYEQMRRFPEGLVVLGDALCSFNPIYGQGMSTSALAASTLDACLRAQAQRTPGEIAGLADRFRKQIAGVIAIPWMLATGEDFRYPQTEGKRPPATNLLNAYIGRLHEATGQDAQVLVPFVKVMNMLKPPFSLFAPALMWRVLTAPRAGRPAAVKAVPRAAEAQPSLGRGA